MPSHTEKPCKSPHAEAECPSSATLGKRHHRHGPAIPIALCTVIGGLCGIPLLYAENPIGILTVLPGAIAGAIYYRCRSSKWPIDPAAKRRRYTYAAISTLALPLLAVCAMGMRGQGLPITIGALLLGASIGISILLSGDRRPGSAA